MSAINSFFANFIGPTCSGPIKITGSVIPFSSTSSALYYSISPCMVRRKAAIMGVYFTKNFSCRAKTVFLPVADCTDPLTIPALTPHLRSLSNEASIMVSQQRWSRAKLSLWSVHWCSNHVRRSSKTLRHFHSVS